MMMIIIMITTTLIVAVAILLLLMDITGDKSFDNPSAFCLALGRTDNLTGLREGLMHSTGFMKALGLSSVVYYFLPNLLCLGCPDLNTVPK